MIINKDYMEMMRQGKYSMTQHRKEQEAGQIVFICLVSASLIVIVAALFN
jgi:hypothetical protein